jgi:DNA-binding NarL/FixJ family response regulator
LLHMPDALAGRDSLEDRLPKCILLVDDNPAIRMALRKFLEGHTEYQVCGEASDGLDAIEKAAVLHPDLVVLDLSMPRMDGLEAARELKQRMPQMHLILFTMHAAATNQNEVVEAGFDAVISKTEGLQTLIDKVQTLLAPV